MEVLITLFVIVLTFFGLGTVLSGFFNCGDGKSRSGATLREIRASGWSRLEFQAAVGGASGRES